MHFLDRRRRHPPQVIVGSAWGIYCQVSKLTIPVPVCLSNNLTMRSNKIPESVNLGLVDTLGAYLIEIIRYMWV